MVLPTMVAGRGALNIHSEPNSYAEEYSHLLRRHRERDRSKPFKRPKAIPPMTWARRLLEWILKPVSQREQNDRMAIFRFYLPLCEPRKIDQGARVHESVIQRMQADPTYRPEKCAADKSNSG